ncbi:Helicase associated domain protein [Streptomyces sp. CS7]|uniref:helicase associated domain-containing protein n=1 Tax=Streptomyces sp. CS-7 TaxID=2906769 RepID=UPI0021B38468|nr:DEAD/DEAH box helicase [Streptomyces sp. CS-7]MCT6781501.1 Helicase associated domain protein [Streptomyces sp. CS-7]
MSFARAMPETAARLHAADPAAYPARVGAEWLSGEHAATHRRDVLTRYADGIDAEGWVCELSFLASCRVLGEGVDIRGKRGVQAVVFADTRSSPVEIVQIIGRALRQEPGDGKVSRIIVPVFLEPGEDPGDMMASSSYRGLVAILQGVRAHDDRVIERMALPTTTARGQITSVLALDPLQQTPADENDDQFAEQHDEDDGQKQDDERETAAVGTDEEGGHERGDVEDDEEDQDEGDGAPGIAPITTPLLRFSLPRDPESIALFLRTRVLRPDYEIWLTGYNTLRTWVQEHGDARVPSDTTVKSGDNGTYALGTWVSEQRRAFKAGTLKAWRVDLLNEVGMVWSVGDAAFWKNLNAARAYYAAHSTLACPKNAVWDGVALGQWFSNLRRPGGLGTDPVRAEERRRALEAIDPEWNPAGWSVEWQRHYAAARELLGEEQGRPAGLLPGVTVNGVDVGTWTTRQTDPTIWDTLLPEQQARLEALGLKRRTAAPAGKSGKGSAFERGITALTQYAAREGRVVVPRAHVEETPHGPVRLGTWVSNTRSRRAKLTGEQREQLAALGIDWATT